MMTDWTISIRCGPSKSCMAFRLNPPSSMCTGMEVDFAMISRNFCWTGRLALIRGWLKYFSDLATSPSVGAMWPGTVWRYRMYRSVSMLQRMNCLPSSTARLPFMKLYPLVSR